jgi:hypothetical protein
MSTSPLSIDVYVSPPLTEREVLFEHSVCAGRVGTE